MAHNDTTSRRGHAKIDWDAAFLVYAGDASESYTTVARRFGVSRTAVAKRAKRDDWVQRRSALFAEAAATNERKHVRTLEERQADTVRVAERLREVALAEGTTIDPAVALRMLPVYAKLEQLYEGEATDRPDLGEVQIVIHAIVGAAGRWVASELPPADRRAGFLAELETATAGLPTLEASAA